MMLSKVLVQKTTQLICNPFAKKLITDNKIFWKPVKPLFPDKIIVKKIINL